MDSPLFIRAGNHWWVSDQLGGEDGFMRAAVEEEADKLLPPVNGWQFFTTNGWSSGDRTLECSCHPSAESAGQFVR